MFQNPRGGGMYICSNQIKILSITLLLLLQLNLVAPTRLDDYVDPDLSQEDLETGNPNPGLRNGENRDYFGGYYMGSMGGKGGSQLDGILPQKSLNSMEQENSPPRRDLFLRQLRKLDQYQHYKYNLAKPAGRWWAKSAYFRNGSMKKSIGALAKNRDRNG